METSKNNQFEYNDIRELLSVQLEKLREISSDYFSQPIHVLPSITDNNQHGLEQHLQQESQYRSGQRIVLIPCFVENSYWVGILIEFQASKQITRAEYINSVSGVNTIPVTLQEQFANVYPSAALRIKDFYKHDDRKLSATFTIKNLILAVQNSSRSNVLNQEGQQSYTTIQDGNMTDTYSATVHSYGYVTNKATTSTLIPNTQKEGNEKKLCELQQELNDGLIKLKIRDVAILPERIQKTSQRIKDYEKDKRMDSAEKEKKYLAELLQLQNLLTKISELTSNMFSSQNLDQLEVLQLEQELDIHDPEKLIETIRKTEELIKEYENEERTDDVEHEKKYLAKLKELDFMWKRMSSDSTPSISTIEKKLNRNETGKSADESSSQLIPDEKEKKRLYLQDLDKDMMNLPLCAEKILLELLLHFEQCLFNGNVYSTDKNLVNEKLGKLTEQIESQEFYSQEMQTSLQELESTTRTGHCSDAVCALQDFLRKIRPLNVREIERLVSKANAAALLIRGKDVILLVGETGSGKSTTIQFLAGCKMQHSLKKIASGKSLEHIEVVGPVKNPDLMKITTSPSSKSETRYIAPVTIRLQEILGAHENGIMVLCDAPGIGDTAGPEVDIANSVGILEAIKGATSVKILALSSSKSVGDRGQGIKKLAHILIHMINGIEDKLDAIFYIFTKYPKTANINAVLLDIITNINIERGLQHDTAFLTVLKDMVDKTDDSVFIIDPVDDEPKTLIRRLRRIRDIRFPGEVFRFPMSEDTRSIITNHLQRDKFNIVCAMKHKAHELVLHYLNDLKSLKDMIKQSFVRDAYEDAIHLVIDFINEYCTDIKEKFNRALWSQDGLREEDIRNYKTAVIYLQKIQILKDHIGSSLLTPEVLMQNINFELNKIKQNLYEGELYNPFIEVYLNNFRMLKNSFEELHMDYNSTCKEFEQRYEALLQSASDLIPTNKFKEIADIILIIYKSALVLKDHLSIPVVKKYQDIVNQLLQHLNNYLKKADPILQKIRLSDIDIENLQSYVDIVRSAKEYAPLQDRIVIYTDTWQIKNDLSDQQVVNRVSRVVPTLLTNIYNELITKITNYFDEISRRIDELYEKNRDHALEDIQRLVDDMNAVRKIPELESLTAGTYYRAIENIRGYMQQLERDAEQLLFTLDQQQVITNYRQLARSLARLKNAKWFDQVSSGTYETLMHRITEELVQYICQLDNNLMKVDFTLKYPNNIPLAQDIVAKVELLSVLEHCVPELEKYRNKILQRFLQSTQSAFDRIQKTFNLEDQDVYLIKQQLKELEEIKREYEKLHPARIYLQKQGYSDSNILNREIDDLRVKQKTELQTIESELRQLESHLNRLNEIIRKYVEMSYPKQEGTMIEMVTNAIQSVLRQNSVDIESYLKNQGYINIEDVYEEITTVKKNYDFKSQNLQDQKAQFIISLRNLESIKKEHDSLLTTHNTPSVEEMNFLEEKGFKNFESLDLSIQEKTRFIAEREKNKQAYFFNDRLDTASADNALLYISQCEKVSHDRVKEIATDTNTRLQKYIREYGNFLDQEINRKFNYACTIDPQIDPFQYSHDLEVRLQELSSLEKFPIVFQLMDGSEKLERWRRKFREYHNTLATKMEECTLRENTELSDQLTIAQALCSVDIFCMADFAGNGYGSLYRQYRGKIITEAKVAYRKVLESIYKREYDNADIALSDIPNNRINSRDLDQIKLDLKNSLEKLIKDTFSIVNWLDGKIEREENNRAQIVEIKENIDKIRIALHKNRIMELLDDETKANLRSFDGKIDKILAEIILKALLSMEAFMNADSFSEAEQGMENLSRVQRELTGYCTSSEVIEKYRELNDRLNSIVIDILKRTDFSNVENYSINPPKDLLGKLKMVASHGSARFTQAYTSMLEQIRKSFTLAIAAVRASSLDERRVKIRSLNYALYFLPEDLQKEFKTQIDELSKLISDEENAYKQILDALFTDLDQDEHTIKKIGLLAEQFKKDNMREPLEILREKSLKKLNVYQTNLESYFDKRITSAYDTAKRIFQYQEYVGAYIPEIQGICNNIGSLTTKKFCHCCEILADISSVEEINIIEKAFTDMLFYLEFSNTFSKEHGEIIPEYSLQTGKERLHEMFEYLRTMTTNFQCALTKKHISELYKITIISKKWSRFTEKINQCRSKHNLMQYMLEQMKDIDQYTVIITKVEDMIKDLNTQLNVDLYSDDTTKFEVKRDAFFSNMMRIISTLKEIKIKFKDIFSSILDIEKLEEDLKRKIEKMNTQLLAKASKEELSFKDCDEFRMYYNHLVSFEKHVRLTGFDNQSFLYTCEQKIFDKVASLRKTILTSISNAEQVADMLIKMKFLAENLSMFDQNINDEIDETLNIYKEKQGSAGIMLLTMALEKNDLGGRLISDHACLRGEDWRKRREKMQNQDNLEYVLNELTGDDIAKDILQSRYEVFRKKYDELVSTILKSFDPKTATEPDLEVLITQTKYLVGTLSHKSETFVWSRSFREAIPELLAHIFAIWTLKNTQHYNTTRGIDAARFYLLMPHVGQVIAIFRLLGIGFQRIDRIPVIGIRYKKTISDQLVNNLVEVGTGEGKSVVMAVTACVFALGGVDVNCSCYSEVLSMRDKNDFASVFTALGIEDRIEYGTFNKLCEQLLNEQCNVREKVHDMIINNREKIDKVTDSEQSRLKVLLIDEVDVFLSDKYYGGMYTPSVYLRNPLIKALLDEIWKNRTLKGLNYVKPLPAYRNCATQYKHWLFLFDEAIKDMLAALQSYQSSTYLVQNDKIVYVEGESIVDNVVRGYDTVWAYYYEHQKGNISQSSLETNVGIIIHCGTFSYAEMPLDFAFIVGVTGTLKTLATTEKTILQEVYGVQKTTYMPSVFGSSNRTFDERTDVEVVTESEYFMRIRGEIDTICNASRAILVFFESEIKLMKFYNSDELSSLKHDAQIITEKVSVKDRDLYIKRAATIGRVTLLTRTFGRGTDFICRNQDLLAKGGIHVLQTFFSEELSEEYQIMGRGARQGDRGSYRMVLLNRDLEWILGSAWNEEIKKIERSHLYKVLKQARNKLYESKCGAKGLGIEQRKREHIKSKEFLRSLLEGEMKMINTFLHEQNRGANLVSDCSRTVLLMDATGSMSSLLSAAKETVCTMFERASAILETLKIPSDSFQMQFVVYRDYDCLEDRILQSSAWESKPSNLRAFMTTVSATGGGDYEEAIEIGLWHAVQQSKKPEGLSQVILIGDAPAKDTNAIRRDRKTYGGEAYWNKSKYGAETHYKNELKQLTDRNIPVHTFYLSEGARTNFQKIAEPLSGTCARLDIHTSNGAESLTNYVTKEILKKAAGSQGEVAVQRYEKEYIKTSFTS
ncbi:unnamed protein product [Rotaria sp. Silwood2]|nr:unnamed protein product [Rotaria sp. Silwood2]